MAFVLFFGASPQFPPQIPPGASPIQRGFLGEHQVGEKTVGEKLDATTGGMVVPEN